MTSNMVARGTLGETVENCTNVHQGVHQGTIKLYWHKGQLSHMEQPATQTLGSRGVGTLVAQPPLLISLFRPHHSQVPYDVAAMGEGHIPASQGQKGCQEPWTDGSWHQGGCSGQSQAKCLGCQTLIAQPGDVLTNLGCPLVPSHIAIWSDGGNGPTSVC